MKKFTNTVWSLYGDSKPKVTARKPAKKKSKRVQFETVHDES